MSKTMKERMELIDEYNKKGISLVMNMHLTKSNLNFFFGKEEDWYETTQEWIDNNCFEKVTDWKGFEKEN